jgi:ABC-type multidrug transport system permease subunit
MDVLTGVASVSGILLRSVDRVEAARDYLTPPLVTYKTESREGGEEEEKGPGFSPFSYILIGMSSMFLLMLADNTMKDLYREARFGTLERFRTLNEGLFTFVAAKVVYSIAILMIGSVILFGGGALVFQFQWQNLPQVIVLILCYCLFGAGLMGFIAALAGREKRADVLNNIIVMGLALLGGSMWPPEQMPAIIGEHVTPLLPTFWFSSATRGLQSDYPGFGWISAAALLIGFGILFTGMAAWLFQRRLEKGVKG